MDELEQLLRTVKRELRAQRKTYRDVAVALDLSEASVKRLFSVGSMGLDRLAAIARLLGYTLAELTARAAAETPRLHTLSVAQEEELVSDEVLLLVAVCALNHWTFEEIGRTYRLEAAELVARLLRLARLGLIELLPGNRIRLSVARDFDWLPDGPIRRFFVAAGQSDFLDGDFAAEGGQHLFVHGMLDAEARAELRRELAQLRSRFAQLHERCIASPFAERRGVGLLLATRAWEPAIFARFRR